jgi:uncharacterized membrane protein
MATVLGVFPAMVRVHFPHWFIFFCIGLQVILLTLAVSFLVRSKRSGEAAGTGAPGPLR